MAAVTEIDFEYATLVTVEEMAALARIAGATAPSYSTYADPDVTEAAVEVGIRSLLARRWLAVTTDRSRTVVADGLAELVRALGSSDRFALLARSGSPAEDRRGRVVFLDDQRALVEEIVYPGLVSLTQIDASRASDFVCTVFGLDADVSAAVGSIAQRLARIPDGDLPVGGPEWVSPSLQGGLVVGPASSSAVHWVEEGDGDQRFWILDLGEDSDPTEGVPATPCTPDVIRHRIGAAMSVIA